MATGQSNVERADADARAKALAVERDNKIVDEQKAEGAGTPVPTGVQKYRVLTGAAVFSRPGHNNGQMLRHGELIELDASDENTQRMVDLRTIELASEKYKGRVTGRVLAHAANTLAQTNEPNFDLVDGQGVDLPASQTDVGVSEPSPVLDLGDRTGE